ncbi:PEBP-like protein [Hyaloscypha variabilis]
MLLFGLLSLVLALAAAQTPPGFTPNVTAHLDVIYPSAEITPGISMSKASVASVPTIGTSDEVLSGTYLFIMMDLDVPGSIAGLAAGTRTTLLHAMVTGYKPSGTIKNTTHVLSSTDTGPASYLAPGPPAETPPHPHKYVQLLFPQPVSFAVPTSMKSAILSRVGFDISKFVTAASLDAPLRANWYTVTG